MIRTEYRIPTYNVTVALEAESEHSTGPIEFFGDETDVETVREELLAGHGAFGHILREETTPIDLDYAVLTQFPNAEIIAGVESYDTGLPEDYQT